MPPYSFPRYLLPTGLGIPQVQIHLLKRNLQARLPKEACRHVTGSPTARPSTKPVVKAGARTPKVFVLPTPDKFRPPSHPPRRKAQAPQYLGPQLTEKELVQQKTKQYPNMFPPEGTFMHWFLSSYTTHLVIIMTSLFGMGAFMLFENWRKDSAFRSHLPSVEDIYKHPIRSFHQVVHTYRLALLSSSNQAESMRKNDEEYGIHEVMKRNSYRKYHGYEDKQGMGPWLPAEEKLRIWKEKREGEDELVGIYKPRPQKWDRVFFGINWGTKEVRDQ